MEQRVELRGPEDRRDDVVVQDVSMFRAEMMDPKPLWLACYLRGSGETESRITFTVKCRDGWLSLSVVDFPEQ